MLGTRRSLLSGGSGGASSDPAWITTLIGLGYSVQTALDFRGVSSLEEATYVGPTPTVRDQPGGGLVFNANGLRCDEDTCLDTGVKPQEFGVCYIFFTNADLSPVYYSAIIGCSWRGFLSDRTVYIMPRGVTGSTGSSRYSYYVASPNDTGTHVSGGIGVKEGVGYVNGSSVHSWGWAGTWDAATINMNIGAAYYNASGSTYTTGHYRGTIQGYWQTSDNVSTAHVGDIYNAWVAGL